MVSNIAQGTCGLTYNRGQKYVNSYQVQRSAAPKSRSLLPRSLDKRSTDPFRWTRAVEALGTRLATTVFSVVSSVHVKNGIRNVPTLDVRSE